MQVLQVDQLQLVELIHTKSNLGFACFFAALQFEFIFASFFLLKVSELIELLRLVLLEIPYYFFSGLPFRTLHQFSVRIAKFYHFLRVSLKQCSPSSQVSTPLQLLPNFFPVFILILVEFYWLIIHSEFLVFPLLLQLILQKFLLVILLYLSCLRAFAVSAIRSTAILAIILISTLQVINLVIFTQAWVVIINFSISASSYHFQFRYFKNAGFPY